MADFTPPTIPFLEAKQGHQSINLFGVPYDKTASFRKGTLLAPNAIREISEAAIESYSPRRNQDLADLSFADLGDLTFDPQSSPEEVFAFVYEATGELLKNETIPVIIGGEHSISPGAIRAAFEKHQNLQVLQIDAHADLREHYEGSPHSHACAMRRVLDFLPSEQLIQHGIRSGTQDEFREMIDQKRLVSLLDLPSRLKKAPLWVTFDIDYVDPSECPGTGTPEAGGATYREVEQILDLLSGHQVIGIDLVELSPPLDPSGISTALAAKLLRELLLTLA